MRKQMSYGTMHPTATHLFLVHILNFRLKVWDEDILMTLNQGVGLDREDSLLAVDGGSLGAKQT